MKFILSLNKLLVCVTWISLILLSCNNNSMQREIRILQSRLQSTRVKSLNIIEGSDSRPKTISLSEQEIKLWQTQLRKLIPIDPDSEFAKFNSSEVVGSIAVQAASGEMDMILLMRGRGKFMTEAESHEHFRGVFLVRSGDRSHPFRYVG